MMNYFSNRKKWMAYLILLTFVFTCIVPTNIVGGNSEAWAEETTGQIVSPGGSSSYKDGKAPENAETPDVTISKIISETGMENEFDIELIVTTPEDASQIKTLEKEAAVVLVMDASKSMQWATDGSGYCQICDENDVEGAEDGIVQNAKPHGHCKTCDVIDVSETTHKNITGNSEHDVIFGSGNGVYAINEPMRITTSVNAAKNFVDDFATCFTDQAMLSVVTFNEGASAVNLGSENSPVYWTQLANNADAESNKQNVKNKLDALDDYVSGNDIANRTPALGSGTNISGGLRVAYNLLQALDDNAPVKRYVILLTDGAATKHIASTEDSTLTINTCNCTSDSEPYHAPQTNGENTENAEVYQAKSVAAELKQKAEVYTIAFSKDADSGAAEELLKNVASSDENYKEASTDGVLQVAFEEIFESISKLAEAWTVTDPMGENIEFVGFYDGNVIKDELVNDGGICYGAAEDIKDEQTQNDITTIKWDLKNAPVLRANNDTENQYSLKYKVRLNTLAEGFVEETAYETNGTTEITYMVKKENSDKGTWEDYNGPYTGQFDIPQVEGYLGELTFHKVDKVTSEALSGAEFTLTHSKQACTSCSTYNFDVPITNIPMKAVSDENGQIKFSKIVSGHDYILKETKAPHGYVLSDKEYRVSVAYGETKVYDSTDEIATADFKVQNEIDTLDISGSKQWKDKEDKPISAPENIEEIEIQLFRDGMKYKSTTVSAANWEYAFTDLPKYAVVGADIDDSERDGHEFVYQVREVIPEGSSFIPSYYKTVDNQGNHVVIITNRPIDDTPRTISGEKIWTDGNEQHDEIIIELFGNDKTKVEATTKTSLSMDWKYSFDNLPRYKNGEWINYTISEVEVPGYISTVIPTAEGFDIVNTPYVENQGQIAVKKVVTAEDGAAPPSNDTEFRFSLKIESVLDLREFDAFVAQEAKALEDAHLKAEKAKNEAVQELSKAEEAFKAKTFLTTESQYQFIMVGDSDKAFWAATTSPSAYVYDLTEQNETVGRLNDSVAEDIMSSVLGAIKELANSFSSLYNAPAFLHQLTGSAKATSPSALAFGISETSALLDAHNALNSANRLFDRTKDALTSYNVTTPTAIKVFWKHDGTEDVVPMDTDSNQFDGKYYWLNFDLKNGEENSFRVEATTGAMISFLISETNNRNANETKIIMTDDEKELRIIPGLSTGDWNLTTESAYGFTFNNIYKPQGGGGGGEIPTTINRSVEKVWNDNGNPNRPASIEVQLLKNGEPVESVILDASNGWSYDWANLENGPLWSVQEVNVADGYTASVSRSGSTFIITNTYSTPEEDPEETIPDEDVPTGSVEPGEPLDELEDPEIPLGDAPATGDTNNAAPFMAMMLLAMAGLVITRRKFN